MEHPLLSCVCALCHTWRRVGYLLVAPERSDIFRSVALQRVRDLFVELLDLAEGVPGRAPVAAGGSAEPSRPREAPGSEADIALAEASSKASPAKPPALAGAEEAVKEEKKETEAPARGEAKSEQAPTSVRESGREKEGHPKEKKSKKKDKKKRHKSKEKGSHTASAKSRQQRNPEEKVCGEEAVKAEESQDTCPSEAEETEVEDSVKSPRGRGRSPSLSRKVLTPERRSPQKERSPEGKNKRKAKSSERKRRRSEKRSPESGRVGRGRRTPERGRDRSRREEKKRRLSKSPERRRRSHSWRREEQPRKREARSSPERGRRERRSESDQNRLEIPGGHLPPPEPRLPPRPRVPTEPPPGVFGGPAPRWRWPVWGERKSKGVKRRARNQDIRLYGLDEDRKAERKTRGG